MALLGFTLPPDSGEKLTLGKSAKIQARATINHPMIALIHAIERPSPSLAAVETSQPLPPSSVA